MKRGIFCIVVAVASAAGAVALPDETCDVAVVGGGAAGIAAAIQSGRAGARTVLVEQGHQVGGNMTSGGVNFPGLFHAWGRQVIDGIGWEIVTNCVALDGRRLPDFSKPTGRQHWRHQVTVNIPLFVALAEEALVNAGVTVHYHSAPVRIERDGEMWKVHVAAVGDTRVISCRQIVDCTGNGAVVALLGLERLREERRQPGSFVYTVNPGVPADTLDAKALSAAYADAVRNGRLQAHDARFGIMGFLRQHGNTANYVDDADNSTADLRTRTNMRGRASMLRMYRFLREQPGLANVRLEGMSPEVGIRETYRVRGEYLITHEDYTSGRRFDDSVCFAFYPIDLHDKESGIHPAHLQEGVVATVPLRALVVKGVDGVLAAGRCVSSDRLANSALRVEATCMATGQAAGAAAALAARHRTTALKVDFAELSALLRAHRAIVP